MTTGSDLDARALDFAARWAEASREEREGALRDEAKAIVAEFEQELRGSFAGLGVPEFVAYVEQARADGDVAAIARADVWAIGAMPKQRVVGAG